MTTRPRGTTALAGALLLVAAAAGLGGLLLTMVSGCCGSRDPADPLPAVIGIAVAACVAVAAAGLWSGRMPGRWVLLLVGVVPLVLVASAPYSWDAASLAPVAAAAWLLLGWWVSRPRVRGWRGHRRR